MSCFISGWDVKFSKCTRRNGCLPVVLTRLPQSWRLFFMKTMNGFDETFFFPLKYREKSFSEESFLPFNGFEVSPHSLNFIICHAAGECNRNWISRRLFHRRMKIFFSSREIAQYNGKYIGFLRLHEAGWIIWDDVALRRIFPLYGTTSEYLKGRKEVYNVKHGREWTKLKTLKGRVRKWQKSLNQSHLSSDSTPVTRVQLRQCSLQV